MSSRSNSWIKDACIAAPRALSSEGLMAVVEEEGERMGVLGWKRDARLEAILGMWEVPPDNITWV